MLTLNYSLVGITGRKGYGKDTLATCLIDMGWHKFAFADPLKRMLCQKEGLTLAQVTDPVLKERCPYGRTISPRQMMQELGKQEREKDPDYWVKRWQETVEGIINVVAPDVRYPNEVQAIRQRGGIIVRVNRPDLPYTEPEHESESFSDTMQVDLDLVNVLGKPEIMQRELLNFLTKKVS